MSVLSFACRMYLLLVSLGCKCTVGKRASFQGQFGMKTWAFIATKLYSCVGLPIAHAMEYIVFLSVAEIRWKMAKRWYLRK
jgi:hypothetical protein